MNCVGTSCLNEINFGTYSNILDILEYERSCAVVQPTGTGKSYIMMELLKRFKDSWKIVIAPSRMFLDNLEHNKYWISDKTLTLTYPYIGINCDSVEEILRIHGINPDEVGLIILDEMHRAGAPKWGAGVQNLIALCKNAKTVGLTATPKRYDEDRDMVEELFNGRTAQNINLADAIRLKMVPLLNYTVGMHNINFNVTELVNEVCKGQTTQYILNMLDEYKKKWNFSNYFVRTLNKYIDTSEVGGKHIVFAQSIEEAIRITPVIKKCFMQLYNTKKLKVYCIHSKETKKAEYIEQFFSDNKPREVKVAVVVNMLNESFHCRDIKSISMFRGTQSLNVYMQQIGRAITSDGDVPYIFDFVDNYHTVSSLQEMLTTESMTEIEEMYDVTSFVFNEFNDETYDFVSDMHRIQKLINLDPDTIIEEIKAKLVDSEDGTIFSVEDDNFVHWASMALNSLYIHRLNKEDYEKLIISCDISRHLGYKWYSLYKKMHSNQLEQDELKYIRSMFNKAIILNNLSDLTIDFFKEKGIISKVNKNEERLRLILTKHEPKNFKYRDELLYVIENIKDAKDNSFEMYLAIKKVESYMNGLIPRSWTYDMLGDAVSYWLWNICKENYSEKINKINETYNPYIYLDELLRMSTRHRCKLGIKEVIVINTQLNNAKTLDDLTDAARRIFKYYKMKNLEQVYNLMCKQLHLTVDEENLMDKIAGQTEYISTIKLIEYVEKIKASAYEHLGSGSIEWADYIDDRYNKLVNDCDNILKALNTNVKLEDVELTNHLATDKSCKKYKKVKKEAPHIGRKQSKLSRVTEQFDDIDKVKEQLDSSCWNIFDACYNEALTEWEGYRNYVESDTLFISMIALSNSGLYKDNLGVNKVKTKLQKAIVTALDSTTKIEEDSKNMDVELEKLRDTIGIIGDNLWYLICMVISKKNREFSIKVYEHFERTGNILTDGVVKFFEKTTESDDMIIHCIGESETINDIIHFSEFFGALLESYFKLKSK